MDYATLPAGTLLRADAADGRYTAVRTKTGWLAVKRAGTPTKDTFPTAEAWIAEIPGAPTPCVESRALRPTPPPPTDMDRLRKLMRQTKTKIGLHLNYYSTNEMIRHLRAGPQTPYWWAKMKELMLKAEADPVAADRRNGVLHSRSRIFVIHEGEIHPLMIARTHMAGNYPYEYENQEVIVYRHRVGKTFAEAAVPQPLNLWEINRWGETKKLEL